MIDIIRKKLVETAKEAELEMMGDDEKALFATGRYAACRLLLNGHSLKVIIEGYIIIPPHWPQRQGAESIVKQFQGLL